MYFVFALGTDSLLQCGETPTRWRRWGQEDPHLNFLHPADAVSWFLAIVTSHFAQFSFIIEQFLNVHRAPVEYREENSQCKAAEKFGFLFNMLWNQIFVGMKLHTRWFFCQLNSVAVCLCVTTPHPRWYSSHSSSQKEDVRNINVV